MINHSYIIDHEDLVITHLRYVLTFLTLKDNNSKNDIHHPIINTTLIIIKLLLKDSLSKVCPGHGHLCQE